MPILVTGGTGFIGSHVVEALLDRGERVRCLVRSARRLRWLAGLDIEVIEGDCRQPGTLPSAVRGVDRVVHIAGETFASTEAAFFESNTEGTRNLVEACLASGTVRRFVFLSSQAAAGPGTRDRPARESDSPRPLSAYGRSKLAGEQCCLEAVDHMSVGILRPSAVYGPRDTGFLPYFRLVRRGFLLEFGTGEREISLCFVNDLVEGVVSVIDSHLESGSVYFIADSEPYAWATVEKVLCAHWGIKGRRLIVPGVVLRTAGVIGTAYGAVTGKPVPISRARVAELLEKHWVCDSSAARRDLAFSPETDLEKGLHKAVRWYEQNNWL
jgi:nucleoside-diphosphate-sugar epimerase